MLFLFSSNDFSIAENEFKKVLNENTKVLCFSGADMDWQINNPKELLQGGNYYNERYAPFEEFNVSKDHFYIVHPTDDIDIVRAKFKYADVILLSGGAMESLEILLKQFNLWNIIKISDKNVIGISAGALIQLEKYDITPYIDDDYNYYDTCKGLGLVKDLRLIVHYNNERKEHQEILQYLTDLVIDEMCETNKDIMVVALSDNEGIIIDNDKNYELKVFGRDD